MPTKVYYNNKEVLGDPFVSRSKTPIDYGDRWGMTESITLNGMIEGLDYYDGATNKYAWQHITEDIFKVNFQEFIFIKDPDITEGILLATTPMAWVPEGAKVEIINDKEEQLLESEETDSSDNKTSSF